MARNDIPRNASQIIGLANKMREGLDKLGAELGITQITPADMQNEINIFVAAYSDFNAARSARQTASDAFKTADTAATDWLQITRNVLAGRFGNRWSTMWAQAGFINRSTKVPTRIEERLGLALSLTNFFTANPGYEVASMQVTAAKATALRTAALTAQDAIATADLDLKTKGEVYDVAFIGLTDMMRSLIKILAGTLNRQDPRWVAFGLQIPASDTTPGKPLNVTAGMDEFGNIIPQCDPVPLATRYRWRTRILGVETDFQLVARSTAPWAIIRDVLPGQRMEIIVQVVNNNVQGVASDPIVFTMPLVAPAKAKTPPAVEPAGLEVNEEALAAAGDGTKGRAAGKRLTTLP